MVANQDFLQHQLENLPWEELKYKLFLSVTVEKYVTINIITWHATLLSVHTIVHTIHGKVYHILARKCQKTKCSSYNVYILYLSMLKLHYTPKHFGRILYLVLVKTFRNLTLSLKKL